MERLLNSLTGIHRDQAPRSNRGDIMEQTARSGPTPRFILDADALITCWNVHYANDVFPGLWITLSEAIGRGEAAVLKEVADEVKWPPELKQWLKCNGPYSKANDMAKDYVFVNFVRVVDLLIKELETRRAKLRNAKERRNLATFEANIDHFIKKGADPWLIAVGAALQCTIVTYEKFLDDWHKSSQVKLPNIAKEFGVRWIRPLEFFRQVQLRL